MHLANWLTLQHFNPVAIVGMSDTRTSGSVRRHSRWEATAELLHAADAVQRRLTRVVERHGITLQQYNVLRILEGAPAAGMPVLKVSDELVEHTPGVTRLIDRLERKRLAQRVRSRKDRRRVYCRITPQGLALLEQIAPDVSAAERDALRMLTRGEQQMLSRLLERVRGSHEPKRRRTAARQSQGAARKPTIS